MNNKTKYLLALLLWVVVFLFSSLAQTDVSTPSAAPAEPDYSQMNQEQQLQWLDNSANWGSPDFFSRAQNYPGFFDRPEFKTNAGNFLGPKDTFTSQDTQIAWEYLNRISFTGNEQAISIGDTFFSGDSTTVHQYLRGNSGKVQEFFQARWGPSFTLATVSPDFSYSKDGMMVNGQKTIPLEQYQANVQRIDLVADGFCVTFTGGKNSCFGGTGEGLVSYDSETKAFTMSDGQSHNNQFIQPEVKEGKTPVPGRFNMAADGTITVDGPARGVVFVQGERVQYDNRRGLLILEGDGDFSSQNAEIITRELFIDGAANYNKAARELNIWNHGDSTLGNVRKGETVAIYLDGSAENVGVTSQGQKGVNEVVKIHLDAASPFSRHQERAAEPDKIQPPPPAKELRERARAVPPQPNSLGENGEVWIRRTASNKLVVMAKGKADVGFYRDNVLLLNRPYYRGTDGKAEFDLKRNGDVDLDVRGKGIYSDDQYGNVKYESGQVTVHSGIENKQDGASVALRRFGSGTGKDTDIMDVACFGCGAGQATSVVKTIAFGERLERGNRLFSSVGSTDFNINVVMGNAGVLTIDPSSSQMGAIAEALKGNTAILERYLDMSLSSESRSQDGTPTSQEYLRISKPEGSQGLSLYRELYRDGKKIDIVPPPINLNVGESVGEAIIITSENNKKNVQILLNLLQQKKYGELDSAGLKFDADPDLRRYLKEQTRIDIDLVNNPEYLGQIRAAVRQQQEFVDFRDRLAQDFGVQLNEQGSCIAPPDCQDQIKTALNKGSTLGYVYTAARVRSLQAQNSEWTALKQSEGLEGKESNEMQEQRKFNQKQIVELQRVRAQMDTINEHRESQRREREIKRDIETNAPVEGFDDAESDAAALHDQMRKIKERLQGTEQQIVLLTEELDQLPTATKEVTGFGRGVGGETTEIIRQVPLTSEEKATKEKHLRENIAQLQQQQNGLDAFQGATEEAITDLTSQYVGERPDKAAELALQAGDTVLARSIAVERLIPLASDKGKVILVEAALKEGNLPEAFNYRAVIESVDEKNKAYHLINGFSDRLINEQLGGLNEKNQNYKKQASEDLSRDDSFLDYFGRYYGGVVVGTVASVLPDVNFADPNYVDLLQDQRFKAHRILYENAHASEFALVAYKNARDQGKSPLEALRAAQSFAGGDVDFHLALERQLSGQDISREMQAKIRLDEVMKKVTLHNGDTFVAENEFEALTREFSDTVAGQRAKQLDEELDQKKGIVTARTLDKYRDIAIQISSLDNFIPFATAAKLGRVAVEAGKATRAGIMIAKSATRFAEAVRATEIAKSVATTIDVAATPFRAIGRSAGENIAGIQRALETTGRELADNAVQAEHAVEAARATGNAEEVVRAEQALANARVVQQAHGRTATSNFLVRDRGVTAEHREALREYSEASQQLKTAIETGSPVPREVAQEVLRTADRAEKAAWGARLEDNVVAAVRGRSAEGRVLQVQDDLRGLQGLDVDISPRPGDLAVAGCALCNLEPGAPPGRFQGRNFDYEASHLPPADQQRARDIAARLEQNLDASEVTSSEIREIAGKADAALAARFDQASSANVAARVMDDLREQTSVGRSNGALPIVTPDAAAHGALNPRPLRAAEATPAEVRLMKSTPSGSDLEELIARTATPRDDELARLLLDRQEALQAGNLAEARKIDFEVVRRVQNHGEVVQELRAAGAEDTALARLLDDYVEAGGDLNKNTDYLTVKPAPNLAADVEQAITGRVAQKAEVTTVPEKLKVGGPKISPSKASLDLREGRVYTSEQANSLEGKIIQLQEQDGITTVLGPQLGEGSFGVVYCYNPECSKIIKLPIFDPLHPGITPRESLLQLQAEVLRGDALEKAGIRTARILNPDPDARYLVKEFVEGPTVSKLLKSQEGRLTEAQINSLAEIYQSSIRHGLPLDAHPGNFIWDKTTQQFVLIDNGFGSDTLLETTWQERFFNDNPDGWARFLEKTQDVHDPTKFTRYDVGGQQYVYLSTPDDAGWFAVKKKWGGLFGTKYENIETLVNEIPLEELLTLESRRLGIPLHAGAELTGNALFSLDAVVNGKIVQTFIDHPEEVRRLVSNDVIEGLRNSGLFPANRISITPLERPIVSSEKLVEVMEEPLSTQ